MERSEIRERQTGGTAAPDFAALHPGYETRNGRTKGRPHPWLSLDRTGFALDVAARCRRALRFPSRAEKTRAPRRAARTGMLVMKEAVIKAHEVNRGAQCNASFSPRARRRPG